MNRKGQVEIVIFLIALALIGVWYLFFNKPTPPQLPVYLETYATEPKVLLPHFGSINCEARGARKPITVPGGEYTCIGGGTGADCTLEGIMATNYDYTWGDILSTTKLSIEFTGSNCKFDGYNRNQGVYFNNRIPYEFYHDDSISVTPTTCESRVKCISGCLNYLLYHHQLPRSEPFYVDFPIDDSLCGGRSGVYQCNVGSFDMKISYQPIVLVKYFDSVGGMVLDGTQQCTLQNLWTELNANSGDQPANNAIASFLQTVGIKHTSSSTTTAYTGENQPQQLEEGYGILYIQKWEESPSYNVQQYGNDWVACLPTGSVYKMEPVQTISSSYLIPKTQIMSDAQCCFDTGICAMYGSGWFCDMTKFKCSKSAGCYSDLNCNPSGQSTCVLENSKWFLTDSKCVNNQCQQSKEEVGHGRPKECCRLPSDTCPKNTYPPQYCSNDYKCRPQTEPPIPCTNECCVNEPNTQTITCQQRGYSPEYTCCLGVCKKSSECYGVCNHDGVCDVSRGENDVNCRDDCPLPTVTCYDNCEQENKCAITDIGCQVAKPFKTTWCKFKDCWLVENQGKLLIGGILGFIVALIIFIRTGQILWSIGAFLLLFLLAFWSIWIAVILLVFIIVLLVLGVGV